MSNLILPLNWLLPEKDYSATFTVSAEPESVMTLETLQATIDILKNREPYPICQEVSQDIMDKMGQDKSFSLNSVRIGDELQAFVGMRVKVNPYLPENHILIEYDNGDKVLHDIDTGTEIKIPRVTGE